MRDSLFRFVVHPCFILSFFFNGGSHMALSNRVLVRFTADSRAWRLREARLITQSSSPPEYNWWTEYVVAHGVSVAFPWPTRLDWTAPIWEHLTRFSEFSLDPVLSVMRTPYVCINTYIHTQIDRQTSRHIYTNGRVSGGRKIYTGAVRTRSMIGQINPSIQRAFQVLLGQVKRTWTWGDKLTISDDFSDSQANVCCQL